MSLLSVVTVSHQRHELLLRKAESLREQTLAPELFEWCVAYNGDARAAALLDEMQDDENRRLPFALRSVALSENEPIPVARNAAAALAGGALLLMSDDDVLLPAGCLAAHVAAHGYGPGGVTAAGPAPAPTRVVVGPLRLPEELARGGEREPFERTSSVAGRALWINATGANTSLPRAAFVAAGGYDADFVAYGGEDSDLALRLRAAGARFVRSEAAWAEHVGLVTGDTTKAFAAGRAGVRVWRKHRRAEVGLMLGVHPALIWLKRLLLGSPFRSLFGRRTAEYEDAYLKGAVAELAAGPAGNEKERR